MIQELHITGYRSVQSLRLRLGALNVLTGPNGCGKSNLYRALLLLMRAAQGEFGRAVAEEGGMASILWAGPQRKEPRRVTLHVRVDDWAYELSAGLPQAGPGLHGEPPPFPFDPQIKSEQVAFREGKKRSIVFLERESGTVSLRDSEGRIRRYTQELIDSESALAQILEPDQFPEVSMLCQRFRQWRFYHLFRTDPDAPVRHGHPNTRTNVLSPDGRDLASALLTIHSFGDYQALDRAVDRAFPGARIDFSRIGGAGPATVSLQMPGIQRPFEAQELSDGTLRYLCLAAVLLSPHPPGLIALNEPETSLHPGLLEPLGQLIVDASKRAQLWVTTHSKELADAIEAHSGRPPVQLEMADGATRVVGQGLLD